MRKKLWRRLWNYLIRQFIRYVPRTTTIASEEAKAIAQHIFDTYNEYQPFVMEQIKKQLINLNEEDIKNKEITIFNENIQINNSKKVLDKLTV